ncbi:TetR/AcrR family transcriptional regulator [Aureivirga sp. CE67]|uniref:TetR/AcrR family transcriptional regulator n=1 Tax=Aureivirga sp. CE67 TaxID=1788983 RepID=UPI0018CA1715|nr:TetR/AcrR family transcriptional regulator [Aureivirga sp. CE67]
MELKQELLEIGLELFSTKSYHATGIREITKKAGVPTGSFHYHFKNKEDFALSILDYFFTNKLERETKIVTNSSLNSKEKLIELFEIMIQYHTENSQGPIGFNGCIIGNLGQELCNQSTPISEKINSIYESITETITNLLEAGQKDASVNSKISSENLARFIFDAYEGALLRRKIEKTDAATANFIKILKEL